MARHDRGARAAVLGVLLTFPLIAGCLGDSEFQVAASAPKEGDGLTILLAALGGVESGTKAFYEIRKGDQLVYPPGGIPAKGGHFTIVSGRGETFVPYDRFVVSNGNYEVVVDVDGDRRATLVSVEKWVEYVYMYVYPKSGRVYVDLQLSSQVGGLPNDRIIAEGALVLEVWYHGVDGSADPRRVDVFQERTPPDQTFTRLSYPRSAFDAGPGWYAFRATFHNDQALGNKNVGDDPTMAATDPPRNWVCIDACA